MRGSILLEKGLRYFLGDNRLHLSLLAPLKHLLPKTLCQIDYCADSAEEWLA